MSLHTWSQTAADNDDADSTIFLRDEVSPSVSNNNMRAFMAAVAKFRDDIQGNLVTAGSSTAYTLTTNQTFPSLTDGLMVVCRMHATNGASATLAVDGLTAKALADVYGNALPSGLLLSGSIQTFTYNSTDDKWIAHSGSDISIETGTDMVFQQTSAPVGWTKKTDHNDKAIRITYNSSGSGGSTAFTSVFTDFTISEAQMPAHYHEAGSLTTDSQGAHTHSYTRYSSLPDNLQNVPGQGFPDGFGKGTTTASTGGAGSHTHTISGNSDATGSGTAMDFNVNYVDLIIAEKD